MRCTCACAHVQSSYVTVAMSACTMIFLIVSKEFVNPRIKKYIKTGIPFDIIVVMIATLVSYLLGLHAKYNVSIVESIPTGLPAPRLPDFSIMPTLLVDSISIAIVGPWLHMVSKDFQVDIRLVGLRHGDINVLNE